MIRLFAFVVLLSSCATVDLVSENYEDGTFEIAYLPDWNKEPLSNDKSVIKEMLSERCQHGHKIIEKRYERVTMHDVAKVILKVRCK